MYRNFALDDKVGEYIVVNFPNIELVTYYDKIEEGTEKIYQQLLYDLRNSIKHILLKNMKLLETLQSFSVTSPN